MRQRELSGGSGLRVSQLCLGAMPFGTTVDEQTSFAILDRFVAAGGTTIDTANCYSFWVDGGSGGESEAVLGRWLASRGGRDGLCWRPRWAPGWPPAAAGPKGWPPG